MPDFIAAFRDYGGIWITILSVLVGLAIALEPQSKPQLKRGKSKAKEGENKAQKGADGNAEKNGEEEGRLLRALSRPWLLNTAFSLVFLCWALNFQRLFRGLTYLPDAGTFPELSTFILVSILILAGGAWWGTSYRRIGRVQLFLTYGLILALIGSTGGLILEAPKGNFSQNSQNQDPLVIKFVQRRLAHLGCFGKSERRDGVFENLTTNAVISFQLANNLVSDIKSDPPGTIRDREFSLLARPFPFLSGLERCHVIETSE